MDEHQFTPNEVAKFNAENGTKWRRIYGPLAEEPRVGDSILAHDEVARRYGDAWFAVK